MGHFISSFGFIKNFTFIITEVTDVAQDAATDFSRVEILSLKTPPEAAAASLPREAW